MSAKDYHLVVGNFGTIYISKLSKREKGVMLNDRVEVPKNIFYQIVEQFGKANIEKGYSTLEVKTKSGDLVFELCLPNPKYQARQEEMRKVATDVLELTKGYTPEQREFLNVMKNMLDTMEQLAGYVQELTS